MTKNNHQKLINLFKQAGILKSIVRTGWQNNEVENPESVADHTFRVALMAMVLSQNNKNINQNKLIKMALIHDLGEALIGDMVWEKGSEVIGSQEEKHTDEHKAINEIFKENDLKEYKLLWEEYEAQKTEEAKFLKLIDKLEMALQTLEYQQSGADTIKLQQFWDNSEKYLKNSELEELFEYLKNLK